MAGQVKIGVDDFKSIKFCVSIRCFKFIDRIL